MMFPRSILTSFVVLATTLASFSAISPVSADNVAADTTSSFLRQKKSIDEDDKVPLNHDITIGHGHDLDLDREIYHEEDGMIEADEMKKPKGEGKGKGATNSKEDYKLTEDPDVFLFLDSPKDEEEVLSEFIQVSEEFGVDGDAMFLQISSNMQRMLNLVNDERRSRGIGALCFNHKLNQAAQDHSNDMKNKVFFDHKGSDGSSPGTRMKRRGYDWRAYAENIAANSSIDDAHRSLMNSSGHKRNILNSRYHNIGIGITTYTSGRFRGLYAITQVFGYSSSEGCSSGGGNGSCSDSPRNWYDSDGPEYNCEWYAEGNNCQEYGSSYSNFGKTAKQACCSCGGGSS